ncbi:MAG TPA: 2-C-methyl-D-erythritol 4-phosphate cytidylyltransferase, partial [Caulobacterales bacterium]|nr:2-C-methyl-D-erythritol 4-phosphate cytidylyltransferase [Caulobacterales bacterium]
MKAAGVIVAAGRGERAGRAVPKQFEPIGGRPMLAWSAEAFCAHMAIENLVIVAEGRHLPLARAIAAQAARAGKAAVTVIEGGAARTDSVRNGLEALAAAAPDAVLIHDAARPGVTAAIIEALLAPLADVSGAAPALVVADALKRADGAGLVTGDAARAGLHRVQTPQAFRFAGILAAYRALPAGAALEDDIAVARAAGLAVRLVAGDMRLSKVTMPEDFDAVARLIAPGLGAPLIGAGFDAHRFGPGDHVTLCGVKIPHEFGLIGHSDADAAWHALTDAILGAIGADDIGAHFPPADPRWKDASSDIFLRHAGELAAQAGARLVNADITIVCEAPRIGP